MFVPWSVFVKDIFMGWPRFDFVSENNLDGFGWCLVLGFDVVIY